MVPYDLKNLMPINDIPWESISYLSIFLLGVYIFLKLFFYRTNITTESPSEIKNPIIEPSNQGKILRMKVIPEYQNTLDTEARSKEDFSKIKSN